MSTPARTEALTAPGAADKHRSADSLARARVYIGIVLLVLGMSLSIPSAQTEDWLTVISYLSITAAGLCLIFTGSVRRQGIRDQRNHEAIHSELCRLTERVKTIEIPRQDDVTSELAEYLAARDDRRRDQGGE